MLCRYGVAPDGRAMILIGLSGENVTRLLADEPIQLVLPEQAHGAQVPRQVLVIVGGRTEADIAAQIASSPIAAYVAAHPPTPDQTTVFVDAAAQPPAEPLRVQMTAAATADVLSRQSARFGRPTDQFAEGPITEIAGWVIEEALAGLATRVVPGTVEAAWPGAWHTEEGRAESIRAWLAGVAAGRL